MKNVSAVIFAILTIVVPAKETTAVMKAPDLAQVQAAAEVLWKSDCSKDSVRGSEAQKIMQSALDQITPEIYQKFYSRGCSIPEKKLEAIYRKYPLFYYYDKSFQQMLEDVKTAKPEKGEVCLWLLYNMGIVVKTEKHCFGIDIHHRLAEKLVPYIEFLCVTHNHNDHYTNLFLKAVHKSGKLIYSNFFPSKKGYFKGAKREIRYGDLTIRTFESDHNADLQKFVMPFEIVCGKEPGACVIFHSGDTCKARQLKPVSEKIDFHIVHPYVGLKVEEAAGKTVKADVTLIAHLQEMHHSFDKWRWTYQNGYDAAEKVRAVGKKAWVPMWAEKIVWKPVKQ